MGIAIKKFKNTGFWVNEARIANNGQMTRFVDSQLPAHSRQLDDGSRLLDLDRKVGR